MELGAAVQTAIGCLSPKLRAIVVLRYLQELSYEEVAETLEISMGTVKSRLARAHLALETIFGDSLRRFGFDQAANNPGAPDAEGRAPTLRATPPRATTGNNAEGVA